MNHSGAITIFTSYARFTALALTLLAATALAEDWPQWRGPTRDGVWRETGIVEAFAGPEIELKWTAAVSNGYCGPTVARGRVYVMDRVVEPVELERVRCFDEETGAELWTHEYECVYKRVGYPDGPRASVSIADGLAYALGTMGHLRCLDAVTGELVWKKDPGTDYDVSTPIWGIAAAPLVENDLLIVQLGAKPDACIVALNRRNGLEAWRALEDDASYSAPIVIEQGGKRVLVCWTGENVVGLNPETGEVYWRYPAPATRMIINVPTPVVDGNRLFLTSFYDGACMLRLGQDTLSIENVWQRRGKNERHTDALHSTIATPIVDGGYIYGVDSYGELRCLDARTGDRIWEDFTAVPKARWATIHMVRNGGKVWMFNDQGELIISTLSPEGFNEISRAKLISPTTGQLKRGLGVTWSHPAYANKHVFIRNDTELVCASLAAE